MEQIEKKKQDDMFKTNHMNCIIYSLNTLIKKQRLLGLALLPSLTICCLKEAHFKYKETNRLTSRRKERYTIKEQSKES